MPQRRRAKAASLAPAEADQRFCVRMRPPQTPAAIDRPRLLATGAQGIVAHAPAGYGKSYLLAALWHGRASCLRPWLTLAPADRLYPHFLSEIGAALALEGLHEAVRSTGDAYVDGGLCAQALARASKPVWLTLDAWDGGASAEACAFVRGYLAQGEPRAGLAIGARARPAIGAGSLIASGALALVTARGLAFTPEEARAFLSAAKRQDEEDLIPWSEGWPLALALALAHGKGEVGAYLREETFAPLPDGLRALLLDTAPLLRLSPEIADAMRDRSDSVALLEELEHSGALVTRTQANLHKHKLLQTFLLGQFGLRPAEERNAYAQRAIAPLLLGEGLQAALQFARSAALGDEALTLIEQGLGGVFELDDMERLVASAPALHGQRSQKTPRLNALLALAQSAHDGQGAQAAARAAHDQIESLSARSEGDNYALLLDASFEWGGSGDIPARMSAFGAQASATQALRQGEGARARMFARLSLGAEPLSAHARLGGAGAALIDYLDGEVEAAHVLAEAGESLAHHIVRASLAHERGANESGELALPQGCAMLGLSGEFFAEAARLNAWSAGEWKSGSMRLTQAQAHALERGWRRCGEVLAAEALVLACAFEAPAREQADWAKRLEDAKGTDAQIALARYDLGQGALKRARMRLEGLKSRPLLGRQAWRARVIGAQIVRQGGDETGAQALVWSLLQSARKGLMAGSFFDYGGRALMDLVMDVGARLPHDSEPELRCAVAQLAIADARRFGAGAPQASAEEKALLKALQRTGARAAAAQMLGVSENTAKYHLKRLFHRWGVKDWRVAVAVAETMKMLEPD